MLRCWLLYIKSRSAKCFQDFKVVRACELMNTWGIFVSDVTPSCIPDHSCLALHIKCDSLSVLYLDLYVPGDNALISQGSFSCQPNIYVSWSTSELRVRLALWNGLSPRVKYLTDHSKVVLLLWIFYDFSSPEPKAWDELIGWDSSQRPSVCGFTLTSMDNSQTSLPIVIKFHFGHHWGGDWLQ